MKKILVDMRVLLKISSKVAKELRNLYQGISIKAATLKESSMDKVNIFGKTAASTKEASRKGSKTDTECSKAH